MLYYIRKRKKFQLDFHKKRGLYKFDMLNLTKKKNKSESENQVSLFRITNKIKKTIFKC